MSPLYRIVSYLDELPRTRAIPVRPSTHLGLEPERSETVRRTGAAVNSCAPMLTKAVERWIETFGVKALAAHLSERFALPWEFPDHPTGL